MAGNEGGVNAEELKKGYRDFLWNEVSTYTALLLRSQGRGQSHRLARRLTITVSLLDLID